MDSDNLRATMSEQDNKKPSKKKYNDIFIANSIYPEVSSIFKINKKLEEIKDDSYIVLDTSVLLLPYNTGKEGLSQIKKTYEKLIAETRLVIPAQVAREFAKNRANKLIDLYQSLNKKKEKRFKEGTYPLLEGLDEYQEIIEIENTIEKQLREYKNKIDKVLEHIQNWTWNDPVSLMYSELFDEQIILNVDIENEEIKKDLERRQEYEIPPGYEDASKPDSGVGDLLIWYSILDVGKKYKKSVIFVSGDKKADWWHKKGSDALYPRYELVDEFRRYSEGQSFHIVELSQLLQLYGASETVIKEIKDEEKLIVESMINFQTYSNINPLQLSGKITNKKVNNIGGYGLRDSLASNIEIAQLNLGIIREFMNTLHLGRASDLIYFKTDIERDFISVDPNFIEEVLLVTSALESVNRLIREIKFVSKTGFVKGQSLKGFITRALESMEGNIESVYQPLSELLTRLE